MGVAREKPPARERNNIIATRIPRRPANGGGTPQAIPAPAGYLLPATGRDIAAQAAAALGVLTGLWVAISPLFIVLQRSSANAGTADVIAGLVAAGVGAFALASPRGFPGLQFASLVLGVWVIVSSFILAAKFTIAAPMYWSNSFSGGVLVVLALA